jgi:hypothetical protein
MRIATIIMGSDLWPEANDAIVFSEKETLARFGK